VQMLFCRIAANMSKETAKKYTVDEQFIEICSTKVAKNFKI